MTDHLITTEPKVSSCRRCAGTILTGHVEGLPVRVDPRPLDRHAELDALLAGLVTYTLHRSGLIYRDADRIAGRRDHGPVLADHHCTRRVQARPIPIVSQPPGPPPF